MDKKKEILTDREYSAWIEEVTGDLCFLVDEGFLERRDFRDLRLTKPILMEKLQSLSRDIQRKEEFGATHGKTPEEVLTPREFKAGEALRNIFALDDRIGIREPFAHVQARRWEQPLVHEWGFPRKFCDRALWVISERVLASASASVSRLQRKCNRMRYDLSP